MKLFPFIIFVSTYIWKWHDIDMYFIYGVEESGASRENFCYIIWDVKINDCIAKNIFIVCLALQRGIATSWSLYKIFALVSFFGWLLNWRHFTLYQFSMGSFCWCAFMILHAFINLHACLFLLLIYFWPDGGDLWRLRWLMFRTFQSFVACKDNFI